MIARKKLAWLKPLAAIIALLLSFVVSPVWAQSDSLDRIVVTVNGKPITETDVERRIRLMKFDARQASGTELADDVARVQAIETEISQLLKRQQADYSNITVSDTEVDSRLEELSGQNNISVQNFLAHFESQGLTEDDIKASLEEGLLDERLTQRVLIRRVQVRENEIDRYLKANQSEFEGSEQYNLSVIVIPDSNQMSFAARGNFRKLANEITFAIQSGRNFRQIAEAAVQVQGVESGDLGWIEVDNIAPEILAEISNIGVGDTVGPVKTGDRLVFAFVNDHIEAGLVNLPQIREYHLARIVLHASNEAGSAVIAEQLEDLRRTIIDGADFGSMAKLYSNDSTTRLAGGDMGWVSEDNLPFEYFQPLRSMKSGDISSVQILGNSVYILQLRGARIGSIEVSKRSVVREKLRALKLRSEANKWVDQLRAAATIKYRNTYGS